MGICSGKSHKERRNPPPPPPPINPSSPPSVDDNWFQNQNNPIPDVIQIDQNPSEIVIPTDLDGQIEQIKNQFSELARLLTEMNEQFSSFQSSIQQSQ